MAKSPRSSGSAARAKTPGAKKRAAKPRSTPAAKKLASKPTASKKPAAKKSSAKKPAAKTRTTKSQRTVTPAQVKGQAEKYKSKATSYKNDPKKTERLLKDAEEKARKNPGPISGRLQDLATLTRLIRAYFRKEYRDVPWETVALAIGAIAYFVSPIDLIPDFIPVAGYVDDAAVIGFVIASAANDLHNFREWEARQQIGE